MSLNQWSDTILIAELSNEPALSEDMDALARRLDDETQTMPNVIIDMKNVTQLNSTNLSQLLRLRKQLHTAGKRMSICTIPDSIWSIMLITGLDQIFDFTEDITTSLTSLQIEEE